MLEGIIVIFVTIFLVTILLLSKDNRPSNVHDGKDIFSHFMEHKDNFDVSKVNVTSYGRMPGSFGRYGYDMTNPIVTDDLYEYLGKVIYQGDMVVEDASPICGYKISLFKNPVFHTAVKLKGMPTPIMLYFIKDKGNSTYYPIDFFSKFIMELINEGCKVCLRDNTEELFLLDAEEKIKRKYKVEKIIRLNDSYIGKNWKKFAKNYIPLKSIAVNPKPICPIQEEGESDESYMNRVNDYVKADTEWKKRNKGPDAGRFQSHSI